MSLSHHVPTPCEAPISWLFTGLSDCDAAYLLALPPEWVCTLHVFSVGPFLASVFFLALFAVGLLKTIF